MKINGALQNVLRLFVDTSPVIYFVQNHPTYFDLVADIFDRIDNGTLEAITSPVTLAEALVIPYRQSLTQLQSDFSELIVSGANTVCLPIDAEIGKRAAELRAKYNLSLTDAMQVAVALQAGCEAFLTNDEDMRRVIELTILVLDDLEI